MTKYELKISIENKGQIGPVDRKDVENALNSTLEPLGWKLKLIDCEKIGERLND